MDIHETKSGSAVVLEPEGNLTTNPDAQALERKISALLEAQVRQIVIDGGQVGQIGSGAVRVLLLATRKMDRVGGRVVLCALSEKVRTAFKISGFDKDLTIVGSRREALERVAVPVSPAEASKTAASKTATRAPKGTKAEAAPADAEHPLRARVARALGRELPPLAWKPDPESVTKSTNPLRDAARRVLSGAR
jgi:anti-anti-sigma factor